MDTPSPELNAYRLLHDRLSDMIEGGRLSESDIPDDYQALVESLASIVGIVGNTETPKAEELGTYPYADIASLHITHDDWRKLNEMALETAHGGANYVGVTVYETGHILLVGGGMDDPEEFETVKARTGFSDALLDILKECSVREIFLLRIDEDGAIYANRPQFEWDEEEVPSHSCDCCGKQLTDDELASTWPDIDKLSERLNPGSIVPSGTCPECGSLCYLIGEAE
jgi:hypothetical protein